MSLPRRIARGLLLLTLITIGLDVFGIVARPDEAGWISLLVLAQAGIGGGLVLRVQRRLRTAGRYGVWGLAVLVHAAMVAITLAGPDGTGYGLRGGLSVVVCSLAVWGLVAERQRTRERLTFVPRDA